MHHARIYSNWFCNGVCRLCIMHGYIPTGLVMEFAGYASGMDIFQQVLLWSLQAKHLAEDYLKKNGTVFSMPSIAFQQLAALKIWYHFLSEAR